MTIEKLKKLVAKNGLKLRIEGISDVSGACTSGCTADCHGQACAGDECSGEVCAGQTCEGLGCHGQTCGGAGCEGSSCAGETCAGSDCKGYAF